LGEQLFEGSSPFQLLGNQKSESNIAYIAVFAQYIFGANKKFILNTRKPLNSCGKHFNFQP
jgi:hypothetical protein